MLNTEIKIPAKLSCLLTLNPETDRWIAQCLDFNIVTSGDDDNSAWESLQKVLKLHIDECLTLSPENLQIKAAPEHWNTFKQLEAAGTPAWSAKLHINPRSVSSPRTVLVLGVDCVQSQPEALSIIQ